MSASFDGTDQARGARVAVASESAASAQAAARLAGPPPAFEVVPEAPKKGPALVVLGIVAAVCLFGALFAFLGTPSTTKVRSGEHVRGTSLRAYGVSSLLAPVEKGGEPPKDVLGNLVAPSGARRLSSSCDSIDLYDCKVTFSLPEAPPAVLAFYQSALPRFGWKRISVDPTDHGLGTEVLEQIPSNDGYYWEVGVFVDPASGAVSGASSGGSTVTMQVLEQFDGG